MPAPMTLRLAVDGEEFTLICNGAAPRTLAALAGLLPLPLQLHTPKIAGSHIYWHAPLVEEVEGATAVLDAPPGAFIYWPVRQFLEITYAPLQAETAAVTVLGQLDGPVARVAALADRLRAGQGRRVFAGELRGPQAAPVPRRSGLAADCAALWQGCPAEITGLTASRALMHPAGPVFMAESEARTLHEMLWRLREETLPEDRLRLIAALSVNRSAARLRDFCHLAGMAALLFRLEAALADDDQPFRPMLDLAIMTAGRIAAWLDLLIPWNDVNTAFRAALDRPAAVAR